LALHYFQVVLGLLWLVWVGYWIAAVAYEGATDRSKETERRVGGTGFLFIILLFVMLPPFGDNGVLGVLYLVPPEALRVLGLMIVAAGVTLAIWARRHLGTNWSGVPSLKKRHELVATGPYSAVRHPIYTGIMFGMLGSTLVLGTVGSLAVLVLASLVVAVRVHQEEGLMVSQFGEAYEEYRKKTRTIVPWIL
jgi:protein-S-isoprenylcysteine O-methyltransferase Ste14